MGKKPSINLQVSEETKKWLDEAKNDGHAKGSFLDKGAVFARFVLYSTEDLPTTEHEVLHYRYLLKRRKYYIKNGASASVLAGLDEAIKFQKQIVDSLETGEYKKLKLLGVGEPKQQQLGKE